MSSLSPAPDFTSRQTTAQSLPATPSAANVRTFTDYSGEHTRLTTLHGSTGALEVNNLGGFKLGSTSLANGSSSKFASALESSIDGIVRTNSSVVNNGSIVTDFNSSLNGPMRNGRGNSVGDSMGLAQGLLPKHTTTNLGMTMSHGAGIGGSGMGMGGTGIGGMNPPGIGNGPGMSQFHSNIVVQHSHAINPPPPPDSGYVEVDDMADVFTGLSFKEPSMGAAPGYGRIRPRRSSAPVGEHGFGAIGPQNGYGLWGNSENPLPEKNREYGVPTSRNSPTQQFVSSTNGSYSAGLGPHPSFNTAWVNGGQNNGGGPVPTTKVNIWSQGSMGNTSSRPNSQTSSDSSIQNSPIYSPTNSSSGFGGFVTSSAGVTSSGDTMTMGLLTTTPMGMPVMGGMGVGMPVMGGMGEERADSRSPFRVCILFTVCVKGVVWKEGLKGQSISLCNPPHSPPLPCMLTRCLLALHGLYFSVALPLCHEFSHLCC